MSLINDALKKAQKQRTGDNTPLSAMPSVGGESASRIAKRDKPVGFNSLLLRLGLGAGVVLLVAIGGYFAMRAPRSQLSTLNSQPSAPSSQPSAVSSQPTAVVPTPPPVVPATAPISPPVVSASQPSTLNPQPAAPSAAGFTLPVVTPPPPTPEPVVVKKAPPVAAKPVTNSQPSTLNSQPAVAQPPLKLDSKAITYIESLRVAGIRASASDSKVLMNDRVYRIGDIVEHEMNLKLVGITANSMTFEDEHGGRYTRQF